MEARAGIEPANRGFAVPGITTLLPRHQERGRKYRQGNIRASKKPVSYLPYQIFPSKNLFHFPYFRIVERKNSDAMHAITLSPILI
jgi:hypothetical protein